MVFAFSLVYVAGVGGGLDLGGRLEEAGYLFKLAKRQATAEAGGEICNGAWDLRGTTPTIVLAPLLTKEKEQKESQPCQRQLT